MFAKLVKYGYQGATKYKCSFVLQIQIFHNNMQYAQCLSFSGFLAWRHEDCIFIPPFLHSSDPHKWISVYRNYIVQDGFHVRRVNIDKVANSLHLELPLGLK
jgi:hypothetical protein